LFQIACALIRQANSEHPYIDNWTFGGGTAMMLQINHRESRDIDIFLLDAQALAFLDPQKRDFEFELQPAAYEGDGSRFLRFVFEEIGEIDFIVAHTLTSSPTAPTYVEGETIPLETIPEIITKKIYHRASSLTPRDIFDIAAAGEQHVDSVVVELRSYRNEVTKALAAIDKLNAEFVRNAIAQLAIKDHFKGIAKTALERSVEILHAV
jgi:hypothetical protein